MQSIINRLKEEKNNDHIGLLRKNHLSKIQQQFMIKKKPLSKLDIEYIFLD